MKIQYFLYYIRKLSKKFVGRGRIYYKKMLFDRITYLRDSLSDEELKIRLMIQATTMLSLLKLCFT